MKKLNILYFVSLLILAISIFIIIEYPNSGRMQLIAGLLTAVGFSANIVVYTLKNQS